MLVIFLVFVVKENLVKQLNKKKDGKKDTFKYFD